MGLKNCCFGTYVDTYIIQIPQIRRYQYIHTTVQHTYIVSTGMVLWDNTVE